MFCCFCFLWLGEKRQIFEVQWSTHHSSMLATPRGRSDVQKYIYCLLVHVLWMLPLHVIPLYVIIRSAGGWDLLWMPALRAFAEGMLHGRLETYTFELGELSRMGKMKLHGGCWRMFHIFYISHNPGVRNNNTRQPVSPKVDVHED